MLRQFVRIGNKKLSTIPISYKNHFMNADNIVGDAVVAALIYKKLQGAIYYNTK